MSLPRVLLHICCAPDATACVERLSGEYAVTGYFHNPNIHPFEEYALRLRNAEQVSQALGFPLLPAEYRPHEWNRAVAGLENEPERGRRCEICFTQNLMATAAAAAASGMPFFTTTLTISPHKSAAAVFQAGAAAARRNGVTFLPLDFKKRDGFRRSLDLSRELGLYRQNYCGCRYSLRQDHAAAAGPGGDV